MRKMTSCVWFVATAFCIAVVPAPLRAQAPAPGKQPLHSTTETLPNGALVVRVENLSGSSITALLAVGEATLPDGKKVFGVVQGFDSVMNSPIQQSVDPGQSHTLFIFPANPVRPLHGPPLKVKREGQLKAAIFANGKTWGDPVWIARLLRARLDALEYTKDVMARLQQALSSGTPLRQLADQMHAAGRNRSAPSSYVGDKEIAGQVYGEAAGQMEACSAVHEDQKGCVENYLGRLLAKRNRLLASRPPLSAVAHQSK